ENQLVELAQSRRQLTEIVGVRWFVQTRESARHEYLRLSYVIQDRQDGIKCPLLGGFYHEYVVVALQDILSVSLGLSNEPADMVSAHAKLDNIDPVENPLFPFRNKCRCHTHPMTAFHEPFG